MYDNNHNPRAAYSLPLFRFLANKLLLSFGSLKKERRKSLMYVRVVFMHEVPLCNFSLLYPKMCATKEEKEEDKAEETKIKDGEGKKYTLRPQKISWQKNFPLKTGTDLLLPLFARLSYRLK